MLFVTFVSSCSKRILQHSESPARDADRILEQKQTKETKNSVWIEAGHLGDSCVPAFLIPLGETLDRERIRSASARKPRMSVLGPVFISPPLSPSSLGRAGPSD
jgi:hypothetical protein